MLAEELTSKEVQGLLERLNAKEMGGSEHATVGAVVEATGSDPLTVGRLLAEIRKEDFEERFGIRINQHEKRIETLEVKSQHSPPPVRSAPVIDPYQQAALDRLGKEERQRQALQPVGYVVCGVVALILLLLMLAASQAPTGSELNDWRTSTTTHDGTVYLDSHGKSWVEIEGGGKREPTDQELSSVRMLSTQNKP